MKRLGHRTLVKTFECPLSGVTVEMVRPGRRHKRRVSAIVAHEWGDREPVDILNPPEKESKASPEFIEYLELWQFVLASICMRIDGEKDVIGYERLDTLDAEIVEVWISHFLAFTGFLVETAPMEGKKKEQSSPG